MSAKKILISLLIFLTLVISAAAYFGITKYKTITVNPTPIPNIDPNQPFSVLLLGYGGGSHEGGTLTDTIILIRIFPSTKSIQLVSIPRDLWVQIPIGTTTPYFSKINAAYSIGGDTLKYPNLASEYTGTSGGGQLVKKIVADVTGVTPNYFVSVDFSGFVKAIDLLGGIDINIEKSFTDYMYPIEDKKDDTCGKTPAEIQKLTSTLSGLKLEEQFPCRYEVLEFKKGLTHMDGATALKYVRSRHSPTDGGDFNRAARQRQFILAIKEKVVNLNFFTKAIPLFNTLTNHIRTDIDLSQLEKFLAKGTEYSKYDIKSIALTGENVLVDDWSTDKQSILIPKDGIGKYDSIKKLLSD